MTVPSNVLVFTEPSAESTTYLDIGEVNVLEIPEFGWLLADGVNPLRIISRSAVYAANVIAPSTAPTLAIPGAARATVVGTYTGQPSDGDLMQVGSKGAGGQVAVVFLFKTTLVTDGTVGNQVKIGSDSDETYANVQAFVQGTGTQNSEYHNTYTFNGVEDDFQVISKIEVSARDAGANTITFRYVDYGTVGNSMNSIFTGSNFSFASATLTGGADGTGTAPTAGTYRYFYTWFNSETEVETGRSPIATITKTTNANVTLSSITSSADTAFDFIHIYRTAKSGVEFYQVGSIATGTTTFTDDVTDDDLTASLAPWNQLLHRAYNEGVPPRGRALAYWKGSAWTVGAHLHAEYQRGTVAVTNDSATITFSASGVTTRMVGRTFIVDSTTEEYTILSVSEAGPTAVLDRVYEGTTNGAATYKIKDKYDACRIRRSVPFKYGLWPEDESPGRVDTDDVEGGIALLATKSRLFAFSKTSVVAVTGEDFASWEMSKVGQGVGCVGPRMVIGVEGGGIFLSPDGFYALSPTEALVSISSPKAPKGSLAQGIDGTIQRIAWADINQGYSYFDPYERLVGFGVPLDGARVPNYEIVFDLQNSTWALYKRAEWTEMVQITLEDGSLAMLAGDRDGNLWHASIGASDGFYGAEAVQTVSTGTQTVRRIEITNSILSTSGDGEKGKPVIVLSADGSTVQYGKIADNGTNYVIFAEDLDTAPAAGDQIVLGGIAWTAESGFTTFGEEYRQKTLRSVTIRHAPTTRGEYFLSFAVDGGSFALCPVGTSIGDLTDSTGKIKHMTQWPGDSHAIKLRGFKPGGRVTLRGGVFDIVMREIGTS